MGSPVGATTIIKQSRGERRTIEGKFWAGLTAAQPMAYLDTLTEQGTRVVVASRVGFPTIGAVLLQRIKAVGREVDGDLAVDDTTATEMRSVRLGTRRFVW